MNLLTGPDALLLYRVGVEFSRLFVPDESTPKFRLLLLLLLEFLNAESKEW
jgi:hypothetical protein